MLALIKNKKINWWKIIFVIFVATYALLILAKPNLGITNDVMFLRTLQAGKPVLLYSPDFPVFDPIKLGRFTPMGTIEYNLFGLFSKSPSAFWYFLLHAFQYAVFMVIFVKILSKFTSNKFLIYITPVFLSLTPGMIVTWFLTLGNEKSLVFYLIIFLFFYLRYLEKPKLYYLIFGVISANVAIYCKENAFLALAAFTFCHLLFSRKDNGKSLPSPNNSDDSQTKSPIFSNKARIFDGLIILSSISFPIVYFFYVFLPYQAALVYGKTAANFVAIVKNILNFATIVDPIMILFILPLIGWRIYRIFIKREKPHAIYDSLLATIPVFVAPFFLMNLYEFHYFTPTYVFAIPPLFYFIPKIWNKKLIWKILASMAGFLFLSNTLPFSLHFLTYSKYLPTNFNKTLNFLINEIKSKYPDQRIDIFIDGVESCGVNQTWPYFKLSEFLLYKGLTAEQFDLKSNQKKTPDCDSSIHDTKIPLDQFTVFQKGPLSEISKGDYLIVSPETTDDIKNNGNKDYLKNLNNEYNLVFRTKSAFAFPMLNLKETIRYFLSVGASPGQKFFGISRKQPFMRWPDYYVFIKK